MRALLVALGLFAAAPALADAPFCVVTAYGRNCWYYSADQCEQAAAMADGACVANPRAVPINGSAPFCLMTSVGKNCWYYSLSACTQAAGPDDACVTR